MNAITQEAKNALIEALKEEFKKFKEPYSIRKHIEYGFENAISVVKSFPTSSSEGVSISDGWIPVEEKLPEKNMECLIHTKTGCIEIARFGRFKTASGQENILFHIETVEGWDTVDWKGNYGISHWQPLPNPTTSHK